MKTSELINRLQKILNESHFDPEIDVILECDGTQYEHLLQDVVTSKRYSNGSDTPSEIRIKLLGNFS